MEAEEILIRRLAELKAQANRRNEAIYTFEEVALRYLKEIADKPSAEAVAIHMDQLFPFIGNTPLALVHDGTVQPFIEHEQARRLASKSINNALAVVSAVLCRTSCVWRDEPGKPWLTQVPARITRLCLKGKQAKPYPLSWVEQDRLI